MAGACHLRTGEWAEAQAAAHLQRQGLRLLQRNFRCRAGEIDLIMTDGTMLVFVEVRFRRSERFGGGLASVTVAKQRKLLAAAQLYLLQRGQVRTRCRFDVVSVTKRNCSPDFCWVRNAFGQDV